MKENMLRLTLMCLTMISLLSIYYINKSPAGISKEVIISMVVGVMFVLVKSKRKGTDGEERE